MVWRQSQRRYASKPRPNRPRSREHKEKEKQKQATSEAPDASEPWNVFPSQMPWVASTPHTRVTQTNAVENQEDKLPPQPILPAPPVQPVEKPTQDNLSAEELEMLKHLKGLSALQALPAPLAQQLEQLEERQQQLLTQRALSHGLLNKVQRARSQVQTLHKRISVVDQEWRQFLASVVNKVQLHAEHYQVHRGDLVESLNSKLKDLANLKKDVATASQSLVEMAAEDIQIEDTDLQQQLSSFHQMTAMMQQAASAIDLIDDDQSGDMEDEPVHEEGTPELLAESSPRRATRSQITPAPFRTAGSPGKVAQVALKAKRTGKETKARAATEYRTDST